MKPASPQKVETANMPWETTEFSGVQRKVLASGDAYRASLIRLEPGASLPPTPGGWGVEIFVLSGSWNTPHGPQETGSYTRCSSAQAELLVTETPCTLFVRSGPHVMKEEPVFHIQSSEEDWLPGQGNLRVKPLHSVASQGTALVFWPAGERFLKHKHWGGEEILVLSGAFEDENGRYPEGTWLLSPHLSEHHPFVHEETVILVKTGHLPA
ncbi:MAG: anti-sigma factor ChrR (cupin superfamily) [Glaciecola sp.]|jgi:anti-sigma factor ChrR (cupin superfamily)